MRISLNRIQLQFTTRSKQTGQLQIDRVAFQLTQRLHIFTCSHAFQLCAISATFMWCCVFTLSSSCCRTCLATSRSCSRTLSSSFSCSRRLLFFSMLSSWLWRRMDTSFATWEGRKTSVWDHYAVYRLSFLMKKCNKDSILQYQEFMQHEKSTRFNLPFILYFTLIPDELP